MGLSVTRCEAALEVLGEIMDHGDLFGAGSSAAGAEHSALHLRSETQSVGRTRYVVFTEFSFFFLLARSDSADREIAIPVSDPRGVC